MIYDREYELAAARFPQLARFVCSAPWLLAIVVAGPDSRARERFRKLYPPGREQTRMRVCSRCQRMTPPNGVRRECGDCEADRAGRRFRSQIAAAACDVEKRELTQRWWHRPFGGGSLITNTIADISRRDYPQGENDWRESEQGSAVDADQCAEPTDGRDDVRPTWIRTDREQLARIAQRRFGPQSTTVRFFDPIPSSALSRLPFTVAAAIRSTVRIFDRCHAKSARHVAAELRRVCQPLGQYKLLSRNGVIMLKHQKMRFRLLRYRNDYPFRNPRVGSGRAAGCEATLLSEGDEALQKEIAYVEEMQKKAPDAPDTEKLAPSARRFTRLNPFLRAPEDGRSVVDCFATLHLE